MKVISILVMMLLMNNKHLLPSTVLALTTFVSKMNFADTQWVSYMIINDSVSFWVITLSLWIIMLISMIKTTNLNLQAKTSSSMMLTLLLVFSVWNFFSFFILFEMSMLVIVVMVMVWGYQPERIEAILFMIFTTTAFSLPFFVSLLKNFNHTNFWFMNINMFMWDYLSFMFIFMVKLPVYFIHIWLPKIHVEAPVQGSMILASIMLKLGCYGLIRMTPMSFKINTQWQSTILAFSLWTTLILSMISAIQVDMKSLIAYSSVVHMTTAFMSITLAKTKSLVASIMMMVGHGLCSSALFFTCNILYKYSKSRSTLINKGILTNSPAVALLWFILCMSNAPMPPSINIMGEILTFKSVMNWSIETIPLLSMVMFASSYFSIVLFYTPAHSKFSNNLKTPMLTTTKSLLIIWLHTAPLIMLIIKASTMEM
uniref:NADH-ubiquinone oxidoreductase chain 4 n=1 Tax=Aleurocanthus spiniferus TaxID=593793 RepID=A0A0X8RVI7_ALESP|nr:NADH dehydrogenase subunit 4 [Aleurocanthus spiniferus]AHY04220.1 NADH dehydrogenase subunit 4 [Aleurocanthus spiniferus]